MATANMNLTEIVPGVTTGPQYATDIVNNFSTIDSHDHTTGKGVQVPSSGININADLPFASNGATGLGKSQYNSLGAALSGSSDYRSVHVVSGELYYLDGSGNAVQLTSSGSVAGSTGNITGLSSPASVTFSTNKYIFKDTANSFAIMESADVRIFEDSASAITNYVALKSPASLAATYTFTLPPSTPSTSKYMTSNSSGALYFSSGLDVYNATGRSTGVTVTAGNIGRSGRISDSVSSTSYATVQLAATGDATVTITTVGKPVMIVVVPFASSSYQAYLGIYQNAGTESVGYGSLRIYRDATLAGETTISVGGYPATVSNPLQTHTPLAMFLDYPSSGTYSYTLQFATSSANWTFEITQLELLVYEL